MLNITYPLEGFSMIALALGLGLFLHHRLGLRWRLFTAGVLTFIASQVVHIPLLIGITALFAQNVLPGPPAEWRLPFNAVVLGLLAGLCEEIARWAAYRYFIRSARTWHEALMFGAGHGGIEAILSGLTVLGTFIAFSAMSPAQVDALPAAAQAQVQAFRSAPDLLPLVGVLERISALCVHLGLAVLVLQVFTRGSPLYLVAAVLWHALVDGVAVYAASTWGVGVTESIIGVMALISLAVMFALRPHPTVQQPVANPGTTS
jgi:uncharacterized membrane protein YhfC